MEDRDLDKLFKKAEEGFTAEPPSFVWDGIEEDLKKAKRKRRFFIWFFFGIFAVLVGTIGFTKFYELNNSERTAQIETAKYESEKEGIVTSDTEELHEAKNEKNTIQIPTRKVDHIESKRVTNHSKIVTHQNQSQHKNIEHNQIISSSLRSNTRTVEENSAEDKGLSLANSINSKERNSTLSSMPNSDSKEGELVEYENGLERLFDDLESLGTRLYQPVYTPRRLKHSNFAVEPMLMKMNSKSNTFYAQIHVGKPFFRYSDPNNIDELSSSNWYSYGLSFAVSNEIYENLHFGIGINYRQSKRKFDFISGELLLEDGPARPNTPEEIFEYEILQSKGEQIFTFFEIPATIQYELWSSGVSISVGASIALNLRLMTKGKGVNTNGSIVRYSVDDDRFQSSIGVGLSPFITLGFPIDEDMNLTITPMLTSYTTTLKNAGNQSEMRYLNAGINFGLAKKF